MADTHTEFFNCQTLIGTVTPVSYMNGLIFWRENQRGKIFKRNVQISEKMNQTFFYMAFYFFIASG